MDAKGIVWVGTRTDKVSEMTTFLTEVMGLKVKHSEEDFVALEVPGGDTVEIFGLSMEDHAHFTTGPVPEFLVDDVVEARRELEAAGIELLSEIDSAGGSSWFHFRAPDGYVYGVTDK